MRLTAGLAVTLTTTAMLAVPATAHADTGGKTIVFISGKHGTPFRAPATDLTARTPLATGSLQHTILAAVPSPDGRRLLESVFAYTSTGLGVRVVVADRDGGHRRVVWGRDGGKAHHINHDWSLAGITWSGNGRRVYFTGVDTASDYRVPGVPRVSTPVLRTATVSRHGVPGNLSRVPGGTGLSWPTADPTGSRIAAVRDDTATDCTWQTDMTRTSTIVLLHPKTGSSSDLMTTTSPLASCALPVRDLAWSPDGTRIAFDQQVCCAQSAYWTGQIDSVAVDGSDGDTPRVLVPDDGLHLVKTPTWRSSGELWYTYQLHDDGDADSTPRTLTDLFSVKDRNDVVGDPVRQTRTSKRSEDAPSFG